MGKVILQFIAFFALVGVVIYAVYREKHPKSKGPMYVRYLKPDGTFRERPQLQPHELSQHSTTCPLCRRAFNTGADIYNVICPSCCQEVKSRDRDFRPSFITDERDWEYLKTAKSWNFWIVNSDYEHDDIDADKARELMHSLVPKGFGRIDASLLEYREYHDYTVSSYSWLNSTPDTQCAICGKERGYCECRKLFSQKIAQGIYPPELAENLDKLRALQPRIVITGYHRKSGVIHADIEPRTTFSVKDFFTLDDWRTLQFLLGYTRQKGYSKQDVEDAIAKYLQLINKDLEKLVNFYEALARGEKPRIPLLPSTNPESIKEVKEVVSKKSAHQELSEKFSL